MRKIKLKKNRDNTPKSRDSLPVVIIKVNPEELKHKNDDEINSLCDRLNKNLRIARSKRDFDSSKKIEKEICYVQNESNIREKRKFNHTKFLSRK
tara:strand:+ start:727 stop:1011 length:285 start_codon:yes stop_codon:yes gene_type:complete